jgi:hypothetical protein
MNQWLTGNIHYKMCNLTMNQKLIGNRPYKLCNLTMSQRLTGNRTYKMCNLTGMLPVNLYLMDKLHILRSVASQPLAHG